MHSFCHSEINEWDDTEWIHDDDSFVIVDTRSKQYVDPRFYTAFWIFIVILCISQQ